MSGPFFLTLADFCRIIAAPPCSSFRLMRCSSSRVLDPLAGAEDPAFNEPHVPGARIFSSAVAEVRIMKTIVVVSLVLTLPAWSLLAETRQDEKGRGKSAALAQFKQLPG